MARSVDRGVEDVPELYDDTKYVFYLARGAPSTPRTPFCYPSISSYLSLLDSRWILAGFSHPVRAQRNNSCPRTEMFLRWIRRGVLLVWQVRANGETERG